MRQDLYHPIIKDSLHQGVFRLQHEERSGAGAASLQTPVSLWTSTGADVVTLADGVDGQIKIFINSVDGGSVVLTPANFSGASSATVTMLTAGDCVAFLFAGGSWHLLWSTSNIEGTPLVIA